MSYRKEKFLKFKKSELISKVNYLDEISSDEISNLFHEVLNGAIHGFCYSLYEEGQKPGDKISREQINHRIKILSEHSGWVRSFSCTDGNELIPEVAKEHGLKTMVGAWLGKDQEKNEAEIENLIRIAKKGVVDIAAVGNEVLYRNDLSKEELIKYINQVKAAIPSIPVGYVDAYYEFSAHPDVADVCDVILCNCYPYWEGTHFNDSLQHMRQMYYQAKAAGNGKRVIITETGWPSQGESLGAASPSKENAMKYFINTNLWAQDEEVELMYFSSFDESWKTSDEGEVGAFWGIWDSSNNLKY
jgi:exo-beta-1,3-glucanase (GH17 family)